MHNYKMEELTTKDNDVLWLIPEDEEEPYFFNSDIIRSNIKENKKGFPLRLELKVIDIDGKPFKNAFVEIWHADEEGEISGTGDAIGETFFRGIQLTGDDGMVIFETLYPGVVSEGEAPYVNVIVRMNMKFFVATKIFLPDLINSEEYGKLTFTVGIGDSDEYNMEIDEPENFTIFEIDPNPFKSFINISYQLRSDGNVKVQIFNSMNEEIETIFEGHQLEGIYSIGYNLTKLLPGFYTVKLTLNIETGAKEVVVLK